jgi:hypothetical protein
MPVNPKNSTRAPEDPRRRRDFHPQYYPTANGRTGPRPGVTARNDCVILEFLAAYYQLNCEYARLLEVRAMAQSTDRAKAEDECLRAIERDLIIRDGLEDQYAASGIIAEPIVVDGFTMDVKFTFGDVTAAGRLRSAPIMSSANVSIPLPPGIKLENLTFPREDSSHRTGSH